MKKAKVFHLDKAEADGIEAAIGTWLANNKENPIILQIFYSMPTIPMEEPGLFITVIYT